MKPVFIFITSWCPYCKQATSFMNELKKENPKYEELEIKVIDEEREPALAKQYDYYYVPTYFVDGVKLHEGVPTKEIVQRVFEKALE